MLQTQEDKFRGEFARPRQSCGPYGHIPYCSLRNALLWQSHPAIECLRWMQQPYAMRGIFTKIFEIPAIHGRTINVHARCEDKMNATGASILAHAGADSLGKIGVPGSGQSNARGVSGS